jgi:hypothetical protein
MRRVTRADVCVSVGDRAHARDLVCDLERYLVSAPTLVCDLDRHVVSDRARAHDLVRDLVSARDRARRCAAFRASAVVAGAMPGRAARGLVVLAVRLLPVAQRPRYREEFDVELVELPQWSRWGYALRVVASAWELAAASAATSLFGKGVIWTVPVCPGQRVRSAQPPPCEVTS